MKTVSIFPILAAVAATSCIGLALVAPIDDAHAGKGAADKLYCVGPSCPPRPSENKATTTGSNKAKLSPEVRDHRGGSQGGGVRITTGRKRWR